MPAYVIYGDAFLVQEAIRDFESQIGSEEVRQANKHQLSGGQTTLQEVVGLCQVMPFMAEKRLVIVEGLLSIFEPRETRAKGSSMRSSVDKMLNPWKELEQLLPSLPETGVLVFKEGALTMRNPLLKRLSSVVETTSLITPRGEELSRWIKKRAAAKGSTITPGAVRLVSQWVGSDLLSLHNELEKLSLYASNRPIEERDVRALVSQVREASIFTAIDAVLEGRLPVALRIIRRLYKSGAAFPYIVSMLTRQLRLVVMAKELAESKASSKDIAARLRISQEFVIRKTLDQARKHQWNTLIVLYSRLLEADVMVKSGRQQEIRMLEVLVTQLSRGF